jgi:hypothetical protein
MRPVRQDAQDLVEVSERVDGVEAAGGNDAEDRGGGFSMRVGAVEQPVLTPDDDRSQRALCACVVERDVAVE